MAENLEDQRQRKRWGLSPLEYDCFYKEDFLDLRSVRELGKDRHTSRSRWAYIMWAWPFRETSSSVLQGKAR